MPGTSVGDGTKEPTAVGREQQEQSFLGVPEQAHWMLPLSFVFAIQCLCKPWTFSG